MTTGVNDLGERAMGVQGSHQDSKAHGTRQQKKASVQQAVRAPSSRPDFVETPLVRNLLNRALTYAKMGLPVHFRGPTGCGKTTLAMRVAEELGRPTLFLSGDEEFSTSSLVGGPHGYHRRRVIDNFVHSVMKTEDSVDYRWADARLTEACEQGCTLIYDEFNRSRPEANNILLSVLEERVLFLPTLRSLKGYLPVHPNFSAVFTSNPTEYAGVHASQDALLDRMITLDVGHFNRETEMAITQERTGLSGERVQCIVDIVRGLRDATDRDGYPTVRACIRIGEVMARHGEDGLAFGQVCLDVLVRDVHPKGVPDPARLGVLLDLIKQSGWE